MVWRYLSLAPERKILIGNSTLTNDRIWKHSWLPSFFIARCTTYLSVAEFRMKRRDRYCRFLERSVVVRVRQSAGEMRYNGAESCETRREISGSHVFGML